jgi:hypothetical protein
LTACSAIGTRNHEAQALASDLATTYTATGEPARTIAEALPPIAPERNDAITVRRLERRRDSASASTRLPPTFGQTFSQTVGKLSAVAILVIIGLCFAFPAAAAGFALKKYIQVKTAFAETVAGIDAANAAAKGTQLAATLNATQNETTKALVKQQQAA